MTILGIDPGTISVGYAVIEGAPTPRLITSSLLRILAHEPATRLAELFGELTKLIERYHPDVVAVERLFFSTNAKTASAVSEARGVILLTTALARLKLYEYTPLEVKKIITGDGSADKSQLKKMIRLTFRETASMRVRDDVFDAIGIALACFYKDCRRQLE